MLMLVLLAINTNIATIQAYDTANYCYTALLIALHYQFYLLIV